jgi:hypothetical protein
MQTETYSAYDILEMINAIDKTVETKVFDWRESGEAVKWSAGELVKERVVFDLDDGSDAYTLFSVKKEHMHDVLKLNTTTLKDSVDKVALFGQMEKF